MEVYLFIIGAVCAVWGIVSTIVMSVYISHRGYSINIAMYRLYMIKYIEQYKNLTKELTGKTGRWFYSFIISMNLSLVLIVLSLIMKLTSNGAL